MAGNTESEAKEKETHEGTASISSFIELWQLVPRRAEHKMVRDIIDMLEFTLGVDGAFPHRIIKESSMNKGAIESSCDTENLRKKLNEEVEAAKGQIDIQVVESSGNSQIHSISISMGPDDARDMMERALETPQEGVTEPTTKPTTKPAKGIETPSSTQPIDVTKEATNEVGRTETETSKGIPDPNQAPPNVPPSANKSKEPTHTTDDLPRRC